MTTRNAFGEAAAADSRAADDSRAIEALLAGNDLDHEDAAALRPVLLELRGLIAEEPPAPSPDLAALLELPDGAWPGLPDAEAAAGEPTAVLGIHASSPAPTAALETAALGSAALDMEGTARDDATVVDLASRDFTARRLAHQSRTARAWKPGRAALTAAAVVVSLGAAAGAAAAADGDFLNKTADNIAVIVGTLTNTRPAPPAPKPHEQPIQQPGNTYPGDSRPSTPSGHPTESSTPSPSAPVPGVDSTVTKVPGHDRLPKLPDPPHGGVPPVLPTELPAVPTIPGGDPLKGAGEGSQAPGKG